jgi:hypothetical protein
MLAEHEAFMTEFFIDLIKYGGAILVFTALILLQRFIFRK